MGPRAFASLELARAGRGMSGWGASVARAVAGASLALTLALALALPALALEIGEQVAPFTAQDARGKAHSLDGALEEGRILVLVVWKSGSPHCKTYGPRLEKLKQRYGKRVTFLALAPDRDETAASVLAGMRDAGITFPVLLDPGGPISRRLDAVTTPTVYLIDRAKRLRYKGAIDDDPLGNKPQRAEYLAEAIDAVLAGKTPPRTKTGGPGFKIKY